MNDDIQMMLKSCAWPEPAADIADAVMNRIDYPYMALPQGIFMRAGLALSFCLCMAMGYFMAPDVLSRNTQPAMTSSAPYGVSVELPYAS